MRIMLLLLALIAMPVYAEDTPTPSEARDQGSATAHQSAQDARDAAAAQDDDK